MLRIALKFMIFLIVLMGLFSCGNNENYSYLASQSGTVLGDSIYVTGSFYYSSYEYYGEIYDIHVFPENQYDYSQPIMSSDVLFYSQASSDAMVGMYSSISNATISMSASDDAFGPIFYLDVQGINEGLNNISSSNNANVALIAPNNAAYGLASDQESTIDIYSYNGYEIEGYFTLNMIRQ
ncbi:MAG: hypothetical protein ABIA04_15635 [Pseudomonadota bacterium]